MNRISLGWCFGLLSLLPACGQETRGNGHLASEARVLSGFTSIDNAGEFEVAVQRGDAFSVRVNVDSNILPLLETRVSGDTLQIGSHEQVTHLIAGPHVIVTLPHLTAASLSGSGSLSVGSIAESSPVELTLSGSGNLDFQGSAPDVTTELSGSGEIGLAGDAERAVFHLSGSGSIDARALLAKSGSVDLDGSGNIVATVNGSVDVTLAGSGSVDLFGDVTLHRIEASGSGQVMLHR